MRPAHFSSCIAIVLLTAGCSGQPITIQIAPKPSETPAAAPTPPATVAPATPVASPPPPAVQPSLAAIAPAKTAPAGICESNFRLVRTNDGSALNLRAANSTDAALVGKIANGEEVLIQTSDRSGDWAEVSVRGGMKGWVLQKFLAPVGASQFSGSLKVKTLDGSALRVRTQATLEAPIAASVSNNTTVSYNSTVGEWTNITTPDGSQGFVSSSYLICQ